MITFLKVIFVILVVGIVLFSLAKVVVKFFLLIVSTFWTLALSAATFILLIITYSLFRLLSGN